MSETQPLLGVTKHQTLRFFFEHLRDVVEDDPPTDELLYNASVLAHFASTSAASTTDFPPGPTSLHMVFDLYVLDNWLPDGSGVELCRYIRNHDSAVPIIFTSAIGQRKDIDLAIEAGANRYLVKPYEPDGLVETVKELLNPTGDLVLKS